MLITGPSGSSIYGDKHAFISSDGSLQDLGTLAGDNYSDAYGINNQGQVVGASYTSSSKQHAFIYSGSSLQDIGTLGGNSSIARGINNQGQYVYNYSLTTNISNLFGVSA